MTLGFWTRLWFRWLLCVALSWVCLEGASMIAAHLAGAPLLQEYTLSDTIRRWSDLHRWLAPLAIGIMAGLAWHFFGERNRDKP